VSRRLARVVCVAVALTYLVRTCNETAPESRLRHLIMRVHAANPPESWLQKLIDPINLLTLALAVLAFLQWRILEQTDQTMNRQLDASKAAQRARIGTSGMTMINAGAKDGWLLTPTLRNVGTTQAVSIRVEYRITNPNPSDDDVKPSITYMPKDPGELLEKPRLGKEILSPGVDRNLPTAAISQDEYAKSAGRAFYLSGVVTYRDVFDPQSQHITKFCYQIKGGGGFAFGPFKASAFSSSMAPTYVPCPYWNCADDTCEPDRQDYEQDLDAAFDNAAKDTDQPKKSTK
jgi:hypothetical protein